MNNLKSFIVEFCKEEDGLSAVEYAIAGSLIAAGVVAAFTGLGGAIETAVGEIKTAVES
ncbi:Flp family type IVb pilin [Photobacterium minamisatsumaniensis]|uniref:Flp family type IVb pilin n=1 Tax=Photobacterium minamisatsumaniensis TaxID=2910233 RepID=UPI003D0A4131